MADFVLYNMDVLKALRLMQAESVDCVVTSPPYWGLRDYGVVGQIGLESHPRDWIAKMVEVSRELKRVLKHGGSYWLNVGDTYYGSNSGKGAVVNQETISAGSGQDIGMPEKSIRTGNFDGKWLQPKQKMLMPHRLAIALQDDGWVLRNDVVWHKPSHMPSSVRDRLTNSFEYVFHFVIQKKYYYNLDAIREPHKPETFERGLKGFSKGTKQEGCATRGFAGKEVWIPPTAGKNPGDFWAINPKPYPEAHFACFPPALVEKPLKATCPKEICVKCGKARERIVERVCLPRERTNRDEVGAASGINNIGLQKNNEWKQENPDKFVGWSDCGCGAGFKPGVVLDPFVGSGTTLAVAQKMGLNGIGIELKPDYIPLIKKRLLGDPNQTSFNPGKIKVIT